jgi:hypothetical protein
LYDVFIYPVNVGENFPHQKYILDYPTPLGSDTSTFLKHLKRYILRSKVKIKDVSNDYSLYHLWDSVQKVAPTTPEVPVPPGGLIKKSARLTNIGCVDPRVPGFGYRAVVPNDEGKENSVLFPTWTLD